MIALLVIGVPLLIAANAFFVAAEYALVRSRLDRLDVLESEGARGAQFAHRQIDRIDEYIAACQVGITLASIGIGAVGEPVIAHYLKKPLGTPVGHAAAVTIAGVIAYLILTTTHITFGELAPKIFTVAHPETVARRLARPLEFFTALFRPVSTTLTALARLILRPFGVRSEGLGEEETTSEDLKFLIARSASGGTLDPGEAGMLSGVFHLHEQEARQVMTPIPAVVTVEDIIEEVVGEIADETDPAGGAVRQLQNGDWYVRGHVPITDLADYGLELPSESDAYNSVGGFVFSELGRLRKRGDTVRTNGYVLRFESVCENRIEAVRIRHERPPAPADKVPPAESSRSETA